MASWLPAAIGAGGGLLSGLIGKSGQAGANKMNLKIAREQMDFQERMSGTAYQRAAKDLSAAGLNRILAIGSPATTPAGARAQMQNEDALLAEGVKSGVASAFDAVRLRNETKLNNAHVEQVKAQTGNIEFQNRNLEANTRNLVQGTFNASLMATNIRKQAEILELDRQIKIATKGKFESSARFFEHLANTPQEIDYWRQQTYGTNMLGQLNKWLINLGEILTSGYTSFWQDQINRADISSGSDLPPLPGPTIR